MYYNFCLINEKTKCYVSLSLRLSSIFSVFPVLNASFILSLCVACLPVCVKIVQTIVKQLRTQTLHTVVMEFPETRS